MMEISACRPFKGFSPKLTYVHACQSNLKQLKKTTVFVKTTHSNNYHKVIM